MANSLKTLLLAGGIALGFAGAANAQIAFSLDQNGTSLVSFSPTGDTNTAATQLTDASGAALSIDAITYRPQTGQLYGYDGSSGTLYTIDTASGVASVEFQSDLLPDGFVSFDTNPNLDAFRFINASGANVVYFPENTANGNPDNAGRLIAETVPSEADNISPLAYADGYDEDGTPSLLGNGYTNQLPLDDAQAQDDDLLQYVLDAGTDTLAVLDNNAGTVDFVADAGFDFDVAGGFDVYTDGMTDVAYALLTVDGEQSLFTIDLGTFAFTQILGLQDDFGTLTSLAVFDANPVPVPAAALLFPAGLAGIAAARKRKATKA